MRFLLVMIGCAVFLFVTMVLLEVIGMWATVAVWIAVAIGVSWESTA